MERKKALAVASAATLLLGSGIVAAASFSGASLLGFGASASARPEVPVVTSASRPAAKEKVVVRTKNVNVYDRLVVDTAKVAARAPAPTAPVGTSPAPAPVAAHTAPATGDVSAPAPSTGRSDDEPARSETSSSVPPTTASGATTVPAAAPPSTLPPGVPDDWPAGKPIPPMPANCFEPELHLNGVWACQGPDD